MPNLPFYGNLPGHGPASPPINQNSLSFFPLNVPDYISLNTFNIPINISTQSGSLTLRGGLYSLNASSLSIINSWSITYSQTTRAAANILYISASSFSSAAQNITPGTWWFGIVISTNTAMGIFMNGCEPTRVNAGNAFPGGFIGGRMTASTNALPSSIATSDLDITGSDAMSEVQIIISA